MAEKSVFSLRLRELREAAGLSRKELAERAGMRSEAGVRDLEQGLNGPTWETAVALADALGVSCEAFRQAPATDQSPPKRGRPRKTDRAGEPASGKSAAAADSPQAAPRTTRARKPGKPSLRLVEMPETGAAPEAGQAGEQPQAGQQTKGKGRRKKRT